jgi:hypothetical protein
MFELSVGDHQQEIPMRIAVALAITLGAFAVSPVLAAPAEPAQPVPHHHRHNKHTAAQPAPVVAPAPAAAPLVPTLRPYPPGEGDTDGLSRDPEDCDKGCIDGNPG